MNLRITRRGLLKGAALGIAGLAAGALFQDRVRIGLIGAGSRGRYLANRLLRGAALPRAGAIALVCDVDLAAARHLCGKYARFAEICQDYRTVLETSDVEAVLIATPDHWHAKIALEAIAAGKAVYCEKPLTLTIREGQLLVEAVERSGAVFGVGTQQRSAPWFRTACNLVRAGRLGELQRVEVRLPPGPRGGPFPAKTPPPELDWDRWLGPAPWAEYCPQRHASYRGWYEYGGGTITDWGAHHVDIVHLAMGMEASGPLVVKAEARLPAIEGGFNTPLDFSATLEYANGVAVELVPSAETNGILFEGTRGRIFVNRGRLSGKPAEDLETNPLPEDLTGLRMRGDWYGDEVLSHLRDFLDCVRSRRTPISDVASHHRALTACHLANIAIRSGRTVKWDPATERFVADTVPPAWLAREERSPYLL